MAPDGVVRGFFLANAVLTQSAIQTVVAGRALSESEAFEVALRILRGAVSPVQAGALLAAMSLRGETIDEMTGFARALRARIKPPPAGLDLAIDSCGAGPCARRAVPVSALSSVVAAACGCRVAHYGPRGSPGGGDETEMLHLMGLRVDALSAIADRSLDELGVGILCNGLHERNGPLSAVPRQEIGVRTIFDVVAPLVLPSGSARQLLGVCDARLAETLAHALARLGTRGGLVVCGDDGTEEFTAQGGTQVAEVAGGEVRLYRLVPEDVGAARCAAGGDPPDADASARLALEVLQGGDNAARPRVLLNAAARVYAAGRVGSLAEGMRCAEEAVRSGQAYERFARLRRLSWAA